MFALGKYSQSLFYVEYSIYTNVLTLWIIGSQLFRNCMRYATGNKSFCLGLSAINDVRKSIVYMNYDIILFFYQWLYDHRWASDMFQVR